MDTKQNVITPKPLARLSYQLIRAANFGLDCLIPLGVLVSIFGGFGYEVWRSLQWDCTEEILARQPSQDGSVVAVSEEKTFSTFYFAMTVILAEVHLVTTKPPIRDTLLLTVETGGHHNERPIAVWSGPNVLRITVPFYQDLTVLTRQAEGVSVDLRFDPDDPPARAAWLAQRNMDTPDYRPGLWEAPWEAPAQAPPPR